ncbi:hypothetical protein [Burkholderia lata]|uniref:hypothetical protein n=1 Tax=Burkholderia lata (strain ATCC 17760 / DSM 23089 / LMG 22485 / NCIMB 9086 / R18194 / 383) TaxID=482957 RepID=UPI001582CD0A|nr:hypothetical protein [Burkholderia lata]
MSSVDCAADLTHLAKRVAFPRSTTFVCAAGGAVDRTAAVVPEGFTRHATSFTSHESRGSEMLRMCNADPERGRYIGIRFMQRIERMERAGIPADAHATNGLRRTTASSRATKAAQVRQTIRSPHHACGPKHRSRAGIRPARTLILR